MDGFSASAAKADANATEIGRPVPLAPEAAREPNVLEVPIPAVTFPVNRKLHVKFKACRRGTGV